MQHKILLILRRHISRTCSNSPKSDRKLAADTKPLIGDTESVDLHLDVFQPPFVAEWRCTRRSVACAEISAVARIGGSASAERAPNFER